MYVTLTIPRGSEKLGRCIDDAVMMIIGRWGGCTMTDNMIGYWRDPDTGLLDTEPVCTLGVDVGDAKLPDVRVWFDRLASEVRVKAEQKAVYYRIQADSVGRFIGPHSVIGPKPEFMTWYCDSRKP
jgi:hypothetical protein